MEKVVKTMTKKENIIMEDGSVYSEVFEFSKDNRLDLNHNFNELYNINDCITTKDCSNMIENTGKNVILQKETCLPQASEIENKASNKPYTLTKEIRIELQSDIATGLYKTKELALKYGISENSIRMQRKRLLFEMEREALIKAREELKKVVNKI